MSWYKTQIVLFILFATTSLAFSAFITSFVLHGRSAHFSLSYHSYYGGFGGTTLYDQGIFDLETWTCEVKHLPSFRSFTSLGQQCAAEGGGRIGIAIQSIIAIVMLMAVWWDTKKSGSFITIKHEKDHTACDDEDICELDDVEARRRLDPDEFRPNTK